MLKIIHMNVNGKAVELAIDDRESLLDTLRNHLGLKWESAVPVLYWWMEKPSTHAFI